MKAKGATLFLCAVSSAQKLIFKNKIIIKTEGPMVYNGHQIKMKKVALIVSLALVSVFGMNCAYANNDVKDNTKQNTKQSEDCTAEPTAYVYDVSYYDDGRIYVSVKIRNAEYGHRYRVKVTPKESIKGTVVEGSLYTTVDGTTTSGVTFNCRSGKEENASMCKAYTFVAELLDDF